MSDWGPSPRTGRTRTGKSLKAVRRYYAMKDAAKRKRSPDPKEEEDRNRQEAQHSISKRKRSPDDDKLSKRIAAELKVQQEANEKRTRQIMHANLAPDRYASPQFAPREIGPTFVTEPNESSKSPKSTKSNKSAKSYKSLGSINQIPSGHISVTNTSFTPGLTSIGCILTCFTLAIVHIVTWIFMVSMHYKGSEPKNSLLSSMKSIEWLAIGSLIVIGAVPYWIMCRQKFRHALVTLALMVVSTTNLAIYLIYALVIQEKPSIDKKGTDYIYPKMTLNYWLPITYLICHLIADGVMMKHTMLLISKQIEVKLSDTQMSQYLAPK